MAKQRRRRSARTTSEEPDPRTVYPSVVKGRNELGRGEAGPAKFVAAVIAAAGNAPQKSFVFEYFFDQINIRLNSD